MADPAPPVTLPNSEWIELKNVSATSVDLTNWRIGDAAGQSGPLPAYLLQPDSFVIVCSAGAQQNMAAFGQAISVSGFPSLNNEGEVIFVRAANGSIIHAVDYSSGWYRNELKRNGGWTLEMIDTKNPCAGSDNWAASVNPRGGTPGAKNSIDGTSPDLTSPQLKYAYAMDSLTIVAVFDEPLDSFSAALSSNYQIDGGLSVLRASPIDPLLVLVQLQLSAPLSANTVYNLTANNITDCSGNVIKAPGKRNVGMAVDASAADIVINEILFDPRPNAYDYVEFYNKSNKIIDVSRLFVANRSSSGTVSSIEPIFSTPYDMFPGDYLVITENATSLKTNSLVKNPDAIFELPSLPSYPDDEGDVILLNSQGSIVDEVKYSRDWQFRLINDPEGVSLERIDPFHASQDATNWHSAASTAGYGTPGYKNSQYEPAVLIDATVDIAQKIFSPDNDGHDDVAVVRYKMSEPGYVANLTIFDALGQPVRRLVNNDVLGITGKWNWDGLDDNGNKLPIGIYIIYTEIFNLQAKHRQFRNAIVLARSLKQ